jgi:hypothetical protein
MRPPSSGEPSRGPVPEIALTPHDRAELQQALAACYNTQRAVEIFLRGTSFPASRTPGFEGSAAQDVWSDILHEIGLGAAPGCFREIVTAAYRQYQGNQVLRELAERCGVIGARGDGPPPPTEGPVPEAQAPPSEPEDLANCHVIMRVRTEEDCRQATAVLDALRLDPVEQWSTPHALSFRVNSRSPEQVRRLLERTGLGWTVVPPGARNYLLHALYIEGPDGSRFRITDAPAQQTVGAVADEVVNLRYGEVPTDAGRQAVVDHVGANGAGRRLDPNATLDESGVEDGDTMRVGFQARAAAVDPVTRQDALYRVRNQLRAFADSRDPALEFVVAADNPWVPTEYEVDFRMPSFGPPPSADAAPVDIDRHRVLLQLPPDFPTEAPLVFWDTQIFHPNVFPSYDCALLRGQEVKKGLVCLGTLLESYLPSLSFGSLCSLLMDIAGFRNYNLYKPDGTVDAAGTLRMMPDYVDPYAAAWVESEAGQERIRLIKGFAMGTPPARHRYHNLIERIGPA